MSKIEPQIINVYSEICKYQLQNYNANKTIEWTVNIALWTLTVASGYFIYSTVGSHAIHLNAIILFYGGLTGLHFLWMIKIQNSEEIDWRLFKLYRKKMLLQIKDEDIESVGIRDSIYPFYFLSEASKSSPLLWVLLETMPTAFLSVSIIYICWLQAFSRPGLFWAGLEYISTLLLTIFLWVLIVQARSLYMYIRKYVFSDDQS